MDALPRFYVKSLSAGPGWLVMDRSRGNEYVVGRFSTRKRARIRADELNRSYLANMKRLGEESGASS